MKSFDMNNSSTKYTYQRILQILILLLLSTSLLSQPSIQDDEGNYALQFDGINDEVLIGYDSKLDITGDITICLWYKTESTSWGALVSNHDHLMPDNGYQVTSSSLYGEGGFIYFECAYNDDRDGQSTNASFNDGKWHFVSAVYTPDGISRGRIYVDGIEQTGYFWGGSVALPAIGTTPEYALTIGSAKVQAWFQGVIDEVRIWNKALSFEEIQTNMYMQLTGFEQGLIGYWTFNEGAGNIVNDISINNNPGTIDGATWVSSDVPLGGNYFYVEPTYAYLNSVYTVNIFGINTHFIDGSGTSKIWISNNDAEVYATKIEPRSNTSLIAEMDIPSDVATGLWDISIETSSDSILSRKEAIEIVQEGNYALQFDGVNDYIDCGYDRSLNFNSDESFSVESWIRVDHVNDEDTHLLGTWGNPDVGFYILRVMSGSGLLSFEIEDVNGDCCQISNGSIDLRDGKWHHVAGVRDRYENKLYQYIDGNLDGYENDITTVSLNGYHRFSIGQRFDSYGHHYGRMDEVRVWKKALSQPEIQINMYLPLSGTEDSLVGYWPFNEGAGNQANDLSGNSNHGLIKGAKWVGSSAPVGKVIIFCQPNYAYQNHNYFSTIQGANTHFLDGINSVWLSNGERKITTDRISVTSNTILNAIFYIPSDESLGQWSLNVETSTDSIISMPAGVEILPPPSISKQESDSSAWLRSVFAVDDQTCWAAGNSGNIQKTVNGGKTWKSLNSGTPNVLYSIFFINKMMGWAVGQYGTILSTTNGGKDWISQTSGTSNNLQSVLFTDENVGWVVGSSGTILKTTNGGNTWEMQSSGTSAWLYSTHFINSTTGWVVGNSGTILKTSDGGISWIQQTSGKTNYLFSVYFADSNTGWTVGSEGLILSTTDGGNTWITQENNINSWLRSVIFKDLNTGWAAGNDGVLIMTTDGGDNWSSRKTWTTNTLNSAYVVDDHTGWIVGESGTILGMTMSNLATSIEEKQKNDFSIPEKYILYQNYPNPFNPNTIINYQLPIISYVDLSIYNLLGQKIKTLVSGVKSAGNHYTEWNGTDFLGRRVSSGIYIYELKTESDIQIRKMILIK